MSSQVRRALSRRGEAAWLGGYWVVFVALAALFPRNGDDWGWGSDLGVQRLDDWFAGYNGRYAGDLLILGLTRAGWLTPLAVAAFVVATLFLVLDVTGHRSPAGYALVAVGFLVMPRAQWVEAVAWLSGFSNYALATLGLLVFLGWVKRAWLGRHGGHPVVRCAASVPVAFVSALFVENVTLWMVAAALVATVLLAARRRRVPWDALCWLTGYGVGAAVMFSNSSYRTIGHAHRHQHRIDQSNAHYKLVKISDVMSRLAVGGNVVLNVALVCAALALLAYTARRLQWLVVLGAATAGLGVLGISWTLALAGSQTTVAEPWREWQGIAALLLLALLGAATALGIQDPNRRVGGFGALASIVLLDVPLVFVNPIGPRNFYVSYVLFLVLAGLLAAELPLPRLARAPAGSRAVGVAAAVVAASLCAGYFVVYGTITHAAGQRLDRIRTAVADGARTVTVEELPFSDFVHMPDPSPGFWTRRFAAYYGLPDDLTIVVRPPGGP